jgi:hypothetical protein
MLLWLLISECFKDGGRGLTRYLWYLYSAVLGQGSSLAVVYLSNRRDWTEALG